MWFLDSGIFNVENIFLEFSKFSYKFLLCYEINNE